MWKKKVCGIKDSLFLVIIIIISGIILFVLWIVSNNTFYPFYVYLINGIFFILFELFYILCFTTEPGIIPRMHPDFIKKEETGENSNENNKENNKENNGIVPKPRIFTERECETCKIIRPPGASHCISCDNCVLDYDHHCFFISNCVAKRTHKFFYLFLFFAVISCLYISVCDIIIIIKIFFVSPKGLWGELWNGNKALLFVSSILILIGLILLSLRVYLFISLTPLSIGFILYIIEFYVYYPHKEKPRYYSYNPFIIVDLIGVISFLVFSSATFFTQTRNILSGYTVKQTDSIKKQLKENGVASLPDFFKPKSCKEKFNNLINFLKKDIGSSLIIPERDLVNGNDNNNDINNETG